MKLGRVQIHQSFSDTVLTHSTYCHICLDGCHITADPHN